MPRIVSTVVDVYPFRRAAGHVEFLMLKRGAGRLLADTWQTVHGRIEPGETAVAAALRELGEETGLSPLRLWQIDFVNTFYVARGDQILMCPGFAAEVAADARVQLSDEHSAQRWVAADDAVEAFMWPGQRQAIREILGEIIRPAASEPHLRIPLDT